MARQPRPIRIEGDVAYVPLTKGYEAVIDAADVPLIAGVCWTAAEDGNTVYAYRRSKADGLVRMHRLLTGADRSLDVDHRDGDGLNNRRANLRTATRSQNISNMRITARNTSGYKGVYWHVKSEKWCANIRVSGKLHYLGTHPTIEAAAEAYAKASAELHGEFGRLV